MHREPVELAGNQAGHFPWQRLFKAALPGFSALVLIVFIWFEIARFFSQRALAGWEYLSLAIGSALITVAVESFISQTALDRRYRYRLAFLVPAGIPILVFAWWWGQLLLSPQQYPFDARAFLLFAVVFGILFTGSFLGALVVTFAHEGLWENNSPPPELVQRAVLQQHQERGIKFIPPSLPKRAFDIFLASVGLLASTPVWLACTFLVWFEDPGPILFVKNSVGMGGKNFHQFKLRTMVHGAEEHTGPVLSQRDDRRVLISGRFLRKTALDELPQLLNILLGEMSFVGPRPQRTVLVYQYLQTLPEYAERHQVMPGLAGLAQVAGDYYLTARQKLRFDKLYIRHASLGFDFKLLVLACLVTFWFRWQKNWNGRLPRKILRVGSSISRTSQGCA